KLLGIRKTAGSNHVKLLPAAFGLNALSLYKLAHVVCNYPHASIGAISNAHADLVEVGVCLILTVGWRIVPCLDYFLGGSAAPVLVNILAAFLPAGWVLLQVVWVVRRNACTSHVISPALCDAIELRVRCYWCYAVAGAVLIDSYVDRLGVDYVARGRWRISVRRGVDRLR